MSLEKDFQPSSFRMKFNASRLRLKSLIEFQNTIYLPISQLLKRSLRTTICQILVTIFE